MLKKVSISLLIVSLIFSSIPKLQADETPFMPMPGQMVNLSPEYTPAYLKGIVIHPENALKFDFIIYKGDQPLSDAQKQEEYTKLTKYFLASLAIPDDDQWVNLSPYEKGHVIKDDFGKTVMGRDLLAQDYLLKQITASLIYPKSDLGQKFWDKVFTQAQEQYGTTDIPVNTFNKVWILPDDALIYEKGNTAYVIRNHLKVMLEEDYMSLKNHSGLEGAPAPNHTHTIASQIIKQIVLPELEREVNEDANFAPLRQVYSGMLLATWYKHALRESLLSRIYADKARVKGVDQNPANNEKIYREYIRAYKRGVFNFIRDDVDKYTNEVIPRQYFSGGAVDYAQASAIQGHQVVQLENVPTPAQNAAMVTEIQNNNFDLAHVATEEPAAVRNINASPAMTAVDIVRNQALSAQETQQFFDLFYSLITESNMEIPLPVTHDPVEGVTLLLRQQNPENELLSSDFLRNNVPVANTTWAVIKDLWNKPQAIDAFLTTASKQLLPQPSTQPAHADTIIVNLVRNLSDTERARVSDLVPLIVQNTHLNQEDFNREPVAGLSSILEELAKQNPEIARHIRLSDVSSWLKDEGVTQTTWDVLRHLSQQNYWGNPQAVRTVYSDSFKAASSNAAMIAVRQQITAMLRRMNGLRSSTAVVQADNNIIVPTGVTDDGIQQYRLDIQGLGVGSNPNQALMFFNPRQGFVTLHGVNDEVLRSMQKNQWPGLSVNLAETRGNNYFVLRDVKNVRPILAGIVVDTRDEGSFIIGSKSVRHDWAMATPVAFTPYRNAIFNPAIQIAYKTTIRQMYNRPEIFSSLSDQLKGDLEKKLSNPRYIFSQEEAADYFDQIQKAYSQKQALSQAAQNIRFPDRVDGYTYLISHQASFSPVQITVIQDTINGLLAIPKGQRTAPMSIALLKQNANREGIEHPEEFLNQVEVQIREIMPMLVRAAHIPSLANNPTTTFSTPPNQAMLINPGGIDFNSAHLNLQIKRDGNGVPLPIDQQDLDNIKIDGLVPVILAIEPAAQTPLLSELEISPAS